MKIVVGATAHPLPPTDGMRLHLWHVFRELSRRHDVTLVSQPLPGDDVSPSALEAICGDFRPVPDPGHSAVRERLRREVISAVTGRSKIVETLRRTGLPEAVVAAVRDVRPDVVHLETGACAAFSSQLDAPVVLVPLDADELNAAAWEQVARSPVQRWLVAREARRWRRFERTAYAGCDAVAVVGERDAASLRAADPRLSPYVIPNGVDTERFAPSATPRDRNVVLLHGAMDYAPNVDAAVFAATKILPLLRLANPDARLVLAGRNPSQAVTELAGPDVEVTGELPDLRPLLQSTAVYLCPMRLGSGIKNKLLEAFACGCPTVATELATNGIAATPGHELLVADDAQGLADALAAVLADPDGLGGRLGAAARARAEAMTWAATAEAFERVYEKVAAERTT